MWWIIGCVAIGVIYVIYKFLKPNSGKKLRKDKFVYNAF